VDGGGEGEASPRLKKEKKEKKEKKPSGPSKVGSFFETFVNKWEN
jgi:hypothetical protein